MIKGDRLEEYTVLKKEKFDQKHHIYVCVLKTADLSKNTNTPHETRPQPQHIKKGKKVSLGADSHLTHLFEPLTARHSYERSETTQCVCRGNQKNFHCLNRTGYWVHRHVKVAQIFIKNQDCWSLKPLFNHKY